MNTGLDIMVFNTQTVPHSLRQILLVVKESEHLFFSLVLAWARNVVTM